MHTPFMVVLVDLIVWFFGFELPTGELRIEDVYPKESSIFSLQKLKWNIFTIWVGRGGSGGLISNCSHPGHWSLLALLETSMCTFWENFLMNWNNSDNNNFAVSNWNEYRIISHQCGKYCFVTFDHIYLISVCDT